MVTVKGTPVSIGMKKGSPYTPFLNYHINQFRDAGILQNTLTRYEIKSPCEGPEGDGLPISISIEKVVFLFTILIVGGVTSALILLIEKVIAANKSEQVEQRLIVDQIMAADDSYNSIVSGMVQHINALQIETENMQDNLRRLQVNMMQVSPIKYPTNRQQNYFKLFKDGCLTPSGNLK